MSKKNYNKISTDKVKAAEEVVEEVVAETVEEIIETDDVVIEETPVVKQPVIGVVVGCSKLNIRKGPSLNAEIGLVLNAGDQVIIRETVGDFYKIGNPEAPDYCMKKFISIKE